MCVVEFERSAFQSMLLYCMMSRLILDLTGACVGPDLHANDRSGGDQASGTKSFSSRVTLRMNDAGEG